MTDEPKHVWTVDDAGYRKCLCGKPPYNPFEPEEWEKGHPEEKEAK